ncbi:MAG: cupin domain-containing protein [Acidobacteria bacterium]|nr:cupin domain-containing protein [Acidobacteriota bacterium]
MTLHDWDRIPKEKLGDLLARQAIHTANLTVARIYLAQGALVARHSHANEQITVLMEGKLKFLFDDREILVAAGQAMEIPPHAPHAVEALEDSLALDLFAPRREDWIRGDDAYLRR